MDGICRFRFETAAEYRITQECRCQVCPPRKASTIPPTSTTRAASASSSHVKGRRSHAIVEQALKVLINLLHRGACGCEANTGDGAGILIQMPDRFFRREAPGSASRCLPSGHYGAGLVFLPQGCRICAARRSSDSRRSSPKKGSVSSAGAMCRPTTRRSGRARLPSSRISASCSSAAVSVRRPPTRGCRSAVRAEAVRDPQARRTRGRRDERCRIGTSFYVPSLSSRDAHLQGHADGDPDRADVSRPGRPGGGVGARAGAPAVQHQHVPVLAAGPSLSLSSRTTARSTRSAATSTG